MRAWQQQEAVCFVIGCQCCLPLVVILLVNANGGLQFLNIALKGNDLTLGKAGVRYLPINKLYPTGLMLVSHFLNQICVIINTPSNYLLDQS